MVSRIFKNHGKFCICVFFVVFLLHYTNQRKCQNLNAPTFCFDGKGFLRGQLKLLRVVSRAGLFGSGSGRVQA